MCQKFTLFGIVRDATILHCLNDIKFIKAGSIHVIQFLRFKAQLLSILFKSSFIYFTIIYFSQWVSCLRLLMM